MTEDVSTNTVARPSSELRAVGERPSLTMAAGDDNADDPRHVWIDKSLTGIDRTRTLREALKAYRAHPQVEAAFSRHQIANTAMPSGNPVAWTLIQRARASFDPERSGDIIVFLKSHITPIADTRYYVSTHGSPWDYDRRVPILFWRRSMAPAAPQDAVETVDIMPTLAAMLGVPLGPPAIDGHCLAGISGVVCGIR